MLDRRLYKIIEQSLNEFYIKDYPNNFSNRIIVQKLLFLLTHGNKNPKISLPYRWSFYLHGPYSSEIAHMIYHINDCWSDLYPTSINLEPNDKKCIEYWFKFKQKLDEIIVKNDEFKTLTKEEIFEILATLTYIAGQIGNEKDKLKEKLNSFKPYLKKKLSDKAFNQLYNLLIDFNYI